MNSSSILAFFCLEVSEIIKISPKIRSEIPNAVPDTKVEGVNFKEFEKVGCVILKTFASR